MIIIVFAFGMSIPDSMIVRRHKHIAFAVYESDHHIFKRMFVHLAVSDRNDSFRHEFLYFFGDFLDALYAVEYDIDLTASAEFPLDDVSYEHVILLEHIGLHR